MAFWYFQLTHSKNVSPINHNLQFDSWQHGMLEKAQLVFWERSSVGTGQLGLAAAKSTQASSLCQANILYREHIFPLPLRGGSHARRVCLWNGLLHIQTMLNAKTQLGMQECLPEWYSQVEHEQKSSELQLFLQKPFPASGKGDPANYLHIHCGIMIEISRERWY